MAENGAWRYVSGFVGGVGTKRERESGHLFLSLALFVVFRFNIAKTETLAGNNCTYATVWCSTTGTFILPYGSSRSQLY